MKPSIPLSPASASSPAPVSVSARADAASPFGATVPPAFDIKALYQQACSIAAPGQLVTVLHLGDECTLIASGADAAAPSIVLTLALGRLKTARDFFRGDLPTPLELETAIAQVEDEVYAAHARHRQWVPPGALLVPCATDAALHGIATLAGVAGGPQRWLTMEGVERVFNRLVAVSQGRPAAHEGLPADAPFAAALLVLRELMHHMPFHTLRLLPAATARVGFE